MKAIVFCISLAILISAVIGNGNPINPVSPFGTNSVPSSTGTHQSSTGLYQSSTGTIHFSSTGVNSVVSSTGINSINKMTPEQYRLAKQAGLFAAYPPLNPAHP